MELHFNSFLKHVTRRQTTTVITALLGSLLLSMAMQAKASFHLWDVNELYSNTDGSVQFIEFFTTSNGQQFLKTGGATLTSTDSSVTHTHVFSFPSDLSGSTANKFFLIGTAGFAVTPGGVTPDFTLPDGFLFTAGGSLDFGPGADILPYGALPSTGGLSLNRNGATGVNSPTNFIGQTGSIVPLPAAAWLLGSGLIGLLGVARRKHAVRQ